MSGVGHDKPTYEALRSAFEAHAKEIYGDEYVLQDFVMIGYVVSMEIDHEDRAEYVLATSSAADHIITGLMHQVHLFQHDDESED